MIINFNEMSEKTLPHFKGGEGEMIAKMYDGELGKILLGKLESGNTIGYHKHEDSSEIIYIVSGKADFLYDDGTEEVAAGGCHYCPKGHSHSMINNGPEDLIFFATVPLQ